ncbi:hypothetical protein D3C84_674570 [compost metagenome]
MQADDCRDAVIRRPQPQGAIRLGQWAGECCVDVFGGQRLQRSQFGLERFDRHTDIDQRLPELRQFVQCIAHLLLFVRRVDQLVERQVTLKFVQTGQLIQTFAQGA